MFGDQSAVEHQILLLLEIRTNLLYPEMPNKRFILDKSVQFNREKFKSGVLPVFRHGLSDQDFINHMRDFAARIMLMREDEIIVSAEYLKRF